MQEVHRWEANVLSAFYRYENSTAFLRIYGLDSDDSGLKFNNLFKSQPQQVSEIREAANQRGGPQFLSDPKLACSYYTILPTWDHSGERTAKQMKKLSFPISVGLRAMLK